MLTTGDARTAASREETSADRRVLQWVTAVVAAGYALGAGVQTTWVYARLAPELDQVDLWRRLVANGIGVTMLVLALGLLGVHRTSRRWVMGVRVLLASLLLSATRVGAQLLLGVYGEGDAAAVRAELVTGTGIAVIATSIGVGAMLAQRRSRARARLAEREAVSVELALRALEDEEVRVRRSVAEGLHGTLQQRLVLVDARLERVLRASAPDAPDVVDDLAWVRAQLAEARETDVRQISRLLYPERLDLGLVPAVRAMLGRLPSSIGTRLRVADDVRALDDPDGAATPTTTQRLLVVRVVEEAVTNALKAGPPSTIEVELALLDDVLVVVVTNDGPRYAPVGADAASGFARLAQRLDLAGGRVHVGPAGDVGARVEAHVPLR